MVTVTGTLFTVVLAFVILSAFNTYDGAKSGGASEANALLGMARTAPLFPAAQRDRMQSDLVCYGRAVVNEEWPAMRSGRSSPLVDYWVSAYRTELMRLPVKSLREQAGLQDLLTLDETRTTGRQQRLSDDTPTVPTPLWLALIFGGCVSVALMLGMADPRERLRILGLMVSGFAAIVATGLLVVFFLDHPYQQHTGGIQPSAMRHTLLLMHNQEPGLHVRCSATGRRLPST
jgi:hypothetical protein